MTAHKKERPLKSFVLPNKSYKWDFVLDKIAAENGARWWGKTRRREIKCTLNSSKRGVISSRRQPLRD